MKERAVKNFKNWQYRVVRPIRFLFIVAVVFGSAGFVASCLSDHPKNSAELLQPTFDAVATRSIATTEITQAPGVSFPTASSTPTVFSTPTGLQETETPTPTATAVPVQPTFTPLPQLNGSDISLGLIAELGYGKPWEISWVETDRMQVFSPGGMRTLARVDGSWTEVAAIEPLMADALQYVGSLGALTLNDTCTDGSQTRRVISPDKRVLAYQDSNFGIQIWDLESMELISRIEPPTEFIADIQISLAASIIAVLRPSDGVYLYDLSTGGQVGKLVDSNVMHMAISTSGEEVLTVSDWFLQRWDINTRTVSSVSDLPVQLGGFGGAAFWGTESAILADGSIGLQVVGEEITSAPLEIEDGQLSQSGNRLAIWYYGLLTFLDMNTLEEIITIGVNSTVKALSFSPDEKSTVFITCDGGIWEASLETGETFPVPVEWYSNLISDLKFSPDGSLLAVASPGLPVRIWETGTHALSQILSQGGFRIAFNPDGSQLAIATRDEIQIWALENGVLSKSLEFQGAEQLVYSDPDTIVIGSSSRYSGLPDSRIMVWDLNTETLAEVGDIANAGNVLLSPVLGELAIAHYYPNLIDVYDVGANLRLNTFTISDLPLTVNSDIQELVTADFDGNIHFWNTVSGVEARQFRVPLDHINSASYSPAGDLIALGGANDFHLNNNLIVLARPRTFEIVARMEGQTGVVSVVAVSPVGNMIASGSLDGTIRLWGAIPQP